MSTVTAYHFVDVGADAPRGASLQLARREVFDRRPDLVPIVWTRIDVDEACVGDDGLTNGPLIFPDGDQ